MNHLIEALQQEIDFWKYMLSGTEDGELSPEYQRMKDALELAKYKLLMQLREEQSDQDAMH
jgi:hypothetical protein